MISLLGLVDKNFLLCSSGNHSKFVMDKWAWIMWPIEVNTCVFMTSILESFKLYRTTILWDYSEIAMTAVFSMILSCGSHSKVSSSL